ncbi:hypothetical protein GQ43DRAFT_468861 [Delitschia confertaspora ATCC 74209]|uniref:Uncharacterized protein n=1 Tax=Delitschia confertaspora ATCC 74209 TaxID=1513339 RepID=A0A9P4JUJ1_9PLEO|nr:hypothetical protein GQ43DRAFT_468861 [Delitschia confertaspora ATCC 74209]
MASPTTHPSDTRTMNKQSKRPWSTGINISTEQLFIASRLKTGNRTNITGHISSRPDTPLPLEHRSNKFQLKAPSSKELPHPVLAKVESMRYEDAPADSTPFHTFRSFRYEDVNAGKPPVHTDIQGDNPSRKKRASTYLFSTGYKAGNKVLFNLIPTKPQGVDEAERHPRVENEPVPQPDKEKGDRRHGWVRRMKSKLGLRKRKTVPVTKQENRFFRGGVEGSAEDGIKSGASSVYSEPEERCPGIEKRDPVGEERDAELVDKHLTPENVNIALDDAAPEPKETNYGVEEGNSGVDDTNLELETLNPGLEETYIGLNENAEPDRMNSGSECINPGPKDTQHVPGPRPPVFPRDFDERALVKDTHKDDESGMDDRESDLVEMIEIFRRHGWLDRQP